MEEKTFEIEEAIKDLKGYMAKAAKSGKVDKELSFSLVERAVAILENVLKKLEALEDRVDLIEDKF